MTMHSISELRIPRRIAVFGSPGSGKTRLSRTLAGLLGLPIVHLDDLHWGPGWQRPDGDTWRDRLRGAVQAEEWVIDGDYLPSARLRIEAADLVILVYVPVSMCLWRIVRRAVRIRLGDIEALPRAVRAQAQAGNQVAATHDFVALAWKVLRYPNREFVRLTALLCEAPDKPLLIACHPARRRAVRHRLPSGLAARAHWISHDHTSQEISSWTVRAGAA